MFQKQPKVSVSSFSEMTFSVSKTPMFWNRLSIIRKQKQIQQNEKNVKALKKKITWKLFILTEFSDSK